MRGVWIEIESNARVSEINTSLPMRGVWIEIYKISSFIRFVQVTPHAGSVD